MKCLGVCQTEFVVRMLETAMAASFQTSYLVESRPLARRLHEAGIDVSVGNPNRTDSYLKAEISPTTCVIVEDNRRPGLKKTLAAIADAGATLVYLLGMDADDRRADELRSAFPDIFYLTLAELFGGPLVTEIGRSLTRARVQQYQRYFADGDRVLILLHNDPDPDAMASGLALRNILRRTKATAILGALQGVSRPENLRMANLLDIQVEAVTPAMLGEFDRVAMVDVQPHYFGELFNKVDLVIDHHPVRSGYIAVFKDIRPDYGSTSTILTEHLRAVDVSISERTATALLYAIKSDTLFFNRQANRVDLEAFSFLYPLSDATLIRKMEGAEITYERLEFVMKALEAGRHEEQVFSAFMGETPREDLIAYVADFFLQMEEIKWTVVGGIVQDMLVVSVRNLGYSRNAGEWARKYFSSMGSAGGHRSMAKAVVPVAAARKQFGTLDGPEVSQQMLEMTVQFLREHQAAEKRRDPSKG
jgi:nanoRNase/pAp phosphatase (c-di-AMP/oligoRNAs hydrolase)